MKNEVNGCRNIGASVIIPCYNVGDFLDETLLELENQTYKNFEVICVNDGSKDDTLTILKKWQKKRILNLKIIDKKNEGVSAARNDGIKIASGKYIMFLDADDAYHAKYIERLVGALEITGVDVAYCRLDRKRENVMRPIAEVVTPIIQTQTEAMHNLLYRMGEFGFYCYVYRRVFLEEISLKFDSNTKYGEDREFIWKYLCHCQSACFIDEPLYWYRINNQSVTRGKASWRKTDSLNAVKRTEKYLEENQCTYSKEYKSYMYARVMWSAAKMFAVSGDKKLFKRLGKEFDVMECMKRTQKDPNRLVSLASMLYCVHPKLFFYIVRLKG